MTKELLSTTALYQILSRIRRSEEVTKSLINDFESRCIKCASNQDNDEIRDSLSTKEYLNIIVSGLGIQLKLEELQEILRPLPRDEKECVSIHDFMCMKIVSSNSFRTIDRNSDGYISKGELRLANKGSALNDIEAVMKEADLNKDKKIDYAEYQIYTSEKVSKNDDDGW